MSENETKAERLKEEAGNLKKEIHQQTLGYILAAFGLVAGLAWNEAIKSFIETLFPVSANSLMIKFIYALLVTLVVVLITVYLSRLFKKDGR